MNRKKKKPFNHWTFRLSRAYFKIKRSLIPKWKRQGHRLRKQPEVRKGLIPRLYHLLLKGK